MNHSLLNHNMLQTLGRPYSPAVATHLLEHLIQHIDWQYDYQAFGRRFSVPRLQAWYADEGAHYRYSDNMLKSHPWTSTLLAIKRDVEEQTAHQFNSVLLTYYRTGDDHVTWHADNEAELGETPVIASLSLGVSRRFLFRHNQNNETGDMTLNHGDLLLMHPDFQRHWQHCVPPDPDSQSARVNLTFRHVVMTRN